jgi:hypothetical protein
MRPPRTWGRTQQSSRSVTWCPIRTARRTSRASQALTAVTSRPGRPQRRPVLAAATMFSAGTGQRARTAGPLPACRVSLVLARPAATPVLMSPMPLLASTGRQTRIRARLTRRTRAPIRTARRRITTRLTLTGRRIRTHPARTAPPTSTARTLSGRPKPLASSPRLCMGRQARPVRASRGRPARAGRRGRPVQPGRPRRRRPRGITHPAPSRPAPRPNPPRRPGHRQAVLRSPPLLLLVPTGRPRRQGTAPRAAPRLRSRPPRAADRDLPAVPAACMRRAPRPSRTPTERRIPKGA